MRRSRSLSLSVNFLWKLFLSERLKKGVKSSVEEVDSFWFLNVLSDLVSFELLLQPLFIGQEDNRILYHEFIISLLYSFFIIRFISIKIQFKIEELQGIQSNLLIFHIRATSIIVNSNSTSMGDTKLPSFSKALETSSVCTRPASKSIWLMGWKSAHHHFERIDF